MIYGKNEISKSGFNVDGCTLYTLKWWNCDLCRDVFQSENISVVLRHL